MRYLWTTIYVKDLDESIDFYTDLVGLQMLRRFSANPGIEIAFMGNGVDQETQVELLADTNKINIDYSEFISIGFAVVSLDDMLDQVKSKNVAVHRGPFETPRMRFFCVKDPNGLNVEFFQQK